VETVPGVDVPVAATLTLSDPVPHRAFRTGRGTPTSRCLNLDVDILRLPTQRREVSFRVRAVRCLGLTADSRRRASPLDQVPNALDPLLPPPSLRPGPSRQRFPPSEARRNGHANPPNTSGAGEPGRAVARLPSLRSALKPGHVPQTARVLAGSGLGKQRNITVRPILRPESDVHRFALAIIAMAKAEVEAEKRQCASEHDEEGSRDSWFIACVVRSHPVGLLAAAATRTA